MFVLGILFFVLGPVISVVLMYAAGMLITPWHMPILATAGVLCMALSVWQRGGIARPIGLLLFTALCGLEWFFVAHAIRTPEYTGPAVPGQKLPAFTARKANGDTFLHAELAQGTPSIALFFRGHW
jgi:hypothetical protein